MNIFKQVMAILKTICFLYILHSAYDIIWQWVPPKILSEMGEWKKKGHLKNRSIQSTLSVVKMKDVENYCKNPECQYVCSKQRTSITGKRYTRVWHTPPPQPYR